MSFTPVLTPYDHQVEARNKMRGRHAFALLMGMRTGKTKVLADDFWEMEDAGEVHDMLYVMKAGALYGEDALETQWPLHTPEEARERAQMMIWRSGGGAGFKRELEAFLTKPDPRRPRALLLNTEALSSVKRAREAAQMFLSVPGRRRVMVVGESSSIKGDSERTGACLRLGDLAQYRRIETGTVTPHSPLDLFYQFFFLDPRILRQRSWYGMRGRYAITKQACMLPRAERERLEAEGRRLPEVTVVVGYRNLDELWGLIEPHSYRKLLKDVREAPSAYRFRDVELTTEQRGLYNELKEYATAQLESGEFITPKMKMDMLLKMHQVVCGYAVPEEGGIRPVKENRTAALIDLLNEHDGKAVIWCTYNYNVEQLTEKLRRTFGENSVARFYGGNAGTRVEEERRFKSDPECRYMISNPAAGGMGREWSVADLAVYYSCGPNLEHREQSEMRIEAARKFDLVTRVDLRAPEATVDMKNIKNLRAKIDMASTVQGDDFREWLI